MAFNRDPRGGSVAQALLPAPAQTRVAVPQSIPTRMTKSILAVLLISTIPAIYAASVAQHFIVQPEHVLTTADIADLAARGIEVQRVLPGPRYLVRAEEEDVIIADPRVRSVERFSAARKVAASAYHVAARGRAFTNVRLLFHDDVSFADAQRTVLQAGGTIERPLAADFDLPHGITARIPSAAVTQLANDERVFGIYGPAHRIKPDNAIAAQLSHVTPLFNAPYNLSGQGVVVSIFDIDKADASHPEFGGRVTTHVSGSIGEHPTHVSGTIIAQGIDSKAKGMASAATLHDFNANEDIAIMLNQKSTTLPSLSVVADNNSWGYILGWCSAANCGTAFPTWNGGDELFGGYDALDSAPYDGMAKKTLVLFVHSAGNDGSEGINPVSPP